MAADAGGSSGGVGTIDPGAIPQFDGDLDEVEAAAGAFTRAGSATRRTGTDVHARFQGLSGCYHAPEASQLFASTTPVRTRSSTFAGDLHAVGSALRAYVAEMRPIARVLDTLWSEASWFSASMTGLGEKWDDDPANVTRNNALVRRVNAAVVAKEAAERRCADTIDALYGGTQWHAARTAHPDASAYGVAAIPDGADTPWGHAVEPDRPWYQDFGLNLLPFGEGIGLAAWGTYLGLDALTGKNILATLASVPFDAATWGDVGAAANATGQAWTGLGKLALDAGLHTLPLTAAPLAVLKAQGRSPAWVKDLDAVGRQAAKSLVAWDHWRTDPARAAGETVFNVATIILPVKGAGVAADAARAAEAARAAQAVDAAEAAARAETAAARAGDVAGTGPVHAEPPPTVGDLARALEAYRVRQDLDLPDVRPEPDPASGPPGRVHEEHVPTSGYEQEHVWTKGKSEEGFERHEQRVVDTLRGQGFRVHKHVESRVDGIRTADADVNGVDVEFKTIGQNSHLTSSSVKNELQDAAEDGGQARFLIVDAREVGLTKADAYVGLAKYLKANEPYYEHVEVWLSDGTSVVWNR